MTIYTKTVTSRVSDLFSLKESDIHILNHYGIHGPVFRNSVNLAQELSRRHTSRQIDALFEQGYFHLIKSRQYRNSKKFTKLYGLSIKGFIASLNKKNIHDNYFFKQYLSFFPDKLKSPIQKFLSLCIAEFIVYHKSIGLKIDNIVDMSKYVKDIIYDYDLITKKEDLKIFEKIDEDFLIIDEIRNVLDEIESNEPAEPDEFFIDREDQFEVDEYNRNYYFPRESIKCKFLINFWPYVIDEIGKGTNLELELDYVSEKNTPFSLPSYEENLDEFYKKKQTMIKSQWWKRKLDFVPAKNWYFTSNGDDNLRRVFDV